MMIAKITVAIPLYNKSNYIIETINSVLKQTLLPVEILIVDDGSTDDGPEKIINLNHPLIRLYRQSNAGVAAARNTAIEQACGEFIAFLDADDQFLPEYLAEITAMIQQYPEAGVFSSAYQRVYPDGSCVISRSHFQQFEVPALVKSFHLEWSKCSFISSSSICVRKSLFAKYGIHFSQGESMGEDQDVWLQLAEVTSVAYSAKPLVNYYCALPGSLTASHAVTYLLPCFIRLQQRLLDKKIPAHLRFGAKRLLATQYLNIANQHIRSKKSPWPFLLKPIVFCNPRYLLKTILRF